MPHEEAEGAAEYPYKTSHLTRWIAPSRKELMRIKSVFFERSIRNHIKEKTGLEDVESYFSSCPIDLTKQNELKIWFVRSIIEIVAAHQFDFRISNSTLALYSRFYLRESVCRYSPNLYLFTALIVAIKCENAIVENRTPSRLFQGTGKMTTVFHEALQLESVLCEAVQFDFFILHGDAPFTHYINSYYGYCKKKNALGVPAGVAAGGKEGEELFVEWLQQIQNNCERIYLQMYAVDTHFVFRPAEVAAGVFVHVMKTIYGVEDVDSAFLPHILPAHIRTHPGHLEHVRKLVALTAHEAFKVEQLFAQYDANYWRPKVQEYLKDLRKWTRQLDKTRQPPKRALDAPEDDSKRPKTQP